MFSQSRCFWHPKDTEFVKEYEDAFCISTDNGLAAIADGVSSAIFSRQWADILTRAVMSDPPDLTDGELPQTWLEDRRSEWKQAVDLSSLTFFQRQKLNDIGGGYSTLLWIEMFLTEAGDNDDGRPSFNLTGYAIGDCCFFIVRHGELIRKFPLEQAAEFDADPLTISSVNRNRDHLLKFHTVEMEAHAGDLVILATDALAKWAYQELEREQSVDWERIWSLSQEEWMQMVAELRQLPSGERMRVDDTTLVMLRLASQKLLREEPNTDSHIVVSPIMSVDEPIGGDSCERPAETVCDEARGEEDTADSLIVEDVEETTLEGEGIYEEVEPEYAEQDWDGDKSEDQPTVEDRRAHLVENTIVDESAVCDPISNDLHEQAEENEAAQNDCTSSDGSTPPNDDETMGDSPSPVDNEMERERSEGERREVD